MEKQIGRAGALVKKVVFVTEVLPIRWTGMQPFNRGERFPSAASLSTGLRFFLFLPVPYFFAGPCFYRKISREDCLGATIPNSVDPQHPPLAAHFTFPK